MADYIRPTPQQPALGALAELLKKTYAPQRTQQMQGVMELLGVPAVARTLERMSYGEPLTTGAGGLGGTWRPKPDTVEAALALTSLAPATKGLPVGATIKPKGGNWLAGSVENTVAPLKQPLYPGRVPVGTDERAIAQALGVTPEEVLANADPNSRALNKWLDQKLTKYMRNEMATPEDPVRLQADEFAVKREQLLEQKDRQIAKATADLERARAERGVAPEVLTRSQERLRELRKERAFIEAQQGLHFAPENVVLPSDTAFRRTAGGFKRHGEAKSPAATDWEVLSDTAIVPDEVGVIQRAAAGNPTSGSARVLEANPWMAKAEPEAKFHHLRPRTSEDLGFDHLVDELKNALDPASGLPERFLLKPEDIDKLTVPRAVKLVDEINAWRAVQAQEANAARAGNAATQVVKEYPEAGLKWVELKAPTAESLPDDALRRAMRERDMQPDEIEAALRDPEMRAAIADEALQSGEAGALADALKYEGEMLSHCVGGYCESVLRGDSRILSLRDADGRPRVTIELQPGKPWNERSGIFYDNPELEEPWRQFHNAMLGSGGASPNIKKFPAWLAQNQPEMYAKYEKVFADGPNNVHQIKSKSNKLATGEDVEYVKDFLNSQPFGQVRDLPPGLVDIQDPNALLRALKDVSPERNIQAAVDKFNAVVERNPQAPRFMTLEELKSFLTPPAPKEQKMLQGLYRGYAGEPGEAPELFATPQKRVADYYAQKRAAQTGEAPHAEMLLVDPFAGRAYGHSTPGTGAQEPMQTRARRLAPEDVQGRTQLYAAGGAVRYDPDEISRLAAKAVPGYAAGGVVHYDPAEIDTLVSQIREAMNG